ncbi:hypothetical protein [Picosynechococcus sp. NKBG15041c]|uniref:hypothetical protein n=1 Tax=Picosynechococcus sp. NKBG15041c TaxID=1407650 RepID=UPI0004676A6A|nr:hypothetical protein [Picosynechococcus sp. NKBG15041c]
MINHEAADVKMGIVLTKLALAVAILQSWQRKLIAGEKKRIEGQHPYLADGLSNVYSLDSAGILT